MPWREALVPVRMARVALVAPAGRLRPVLVAVADAGAVQLDPDADPGRGPAAEALARARRQLVAGPAPTGDAVVLAAPADVAALAGAGRLAELAGEAELERVAGGAVRRDEVVAWLGWCPRSAVAGLARRLAPLGGAVVPLARRRGVDPPTLVAASGATGAFQPLVDTYGTVPYADVDPAVLAGVVYVVMFGMMFGDVAHGALLAAAGAVLATGRPRRLARLRPVAPFVLGAGVAAAGFGLAYGDLLGPTHLVPTLWLAPLRHPTTLLAVAVAAGAGLLAVGYGLGTVNRWREGGPLRAALATTGLAGALLYVGIAAAGLGWYRHASAAVVVGVVLAAAGLGLGFAGSAVEAGGVAPGVVALVDAVVRMGTNTVSFARLAAFGLTHAAVGALVWSGTTALWHGGPVPKVLAVLVLVVGNAVAFALEGLAAAVQALRLEYYELFSRVFTAAGRPFRPWHVPLAGAGRPPAGSPAPIVVPEEAACSPG